MSEDKQLSDKVLPKPVKRMQAHETVKGELFDYKVIPSKYHKDRQALKVKVRPKNGKVNEFIIQHSDTDAYRVLYKALTTRELPFNVEVSGSEGFDGRTIKVLP